MEIYDGCNKPPLELRIFCPFGLFGLISGFILEFIATTLGEPQIVCLFSNANLPRLGWEQNGEI